LLLLLLLQAHQWFGDLVTLDDWTELWLNEGFATYFEVVAADAYRPSWGYFDGFLETFTSPGGVTALLRCHPALVSCTLVLGQVGRIRCGAGS
jgi:hypothetical protein